MARKLCYATGGSEMSTWAWGVVPVVEAEARQRKKEIRLIVPCLEGLAGWLVRRPLDVQF